MNSKNYLKKQEILNLESSIFQDSLYEFVKAAWFVIEPSTEFVPNWHIEAICKYLEACTEGKIRNLIINIPPRHMKSLMVNVFFPSWVWTKHPEKKFLFASYAEDLAVRDSLQCRKLVTSEWYQKHWKLELQKDQNQKSKFENTKSGYRISVGVGGAATGEGGDFVIIDDPLKVQDANSDSARNNVNNWYDNTINTRLNNPKTGVKILIQQRLHEDDLTGHLLKSKENYELLCLPAESEGVRFTSSIEFKDPRKEEKELLWPERFGEKELQTLKNGLSSLGVAGQLQQRPSPVGGHIYKEEWFVNRGNNTDVISRYISWDTAASISDTAAYSCGIVGELTSDYRLFIREVVRKKLEFPQLKKEIEDLAYKYQLKLNGIIIESKSSGISVQQSLYQSSDNNIARLLVPFTPTTDKTNRGVSASLWCENGSVILPPHTKDFEWLFDFEDELFQFPNSRYKDQCDSFAQLIIYLENYLSKGHRDRIKQEN